MWVAVPPSDQPANVYVTPPTVWEGAALMEFAEPSITVRENGATDVDEPTVSCRPLGDVANDSETVRGSSRRVTDAERPLESVAVSVSSRYDG